LKNINNDVGEKMRRKEKEITNPSELEEILHKAHICHLGLIDDEMPYVIPVHYGYYQGQLFIHSANEGKKIDLLKKNPKVCFEIELDHQIHNTGIPCNWSTTYKSVIGYGKAEILKDFNEKIIALSKLIDHYAPGTVYDFSKKNVDNVTIICVTIDHMTGKKSLE
jgi:nitroimidazol reductase NimA-like FMN-containing flavoprotein (pyridoxamine 5'-phosphate oxidase superfamily)